MAILYVCVFRFLFLHFSCLNVSLYVFYSLMLPFYVFKCLFSVSISASLPFQSVLFSTGPLSDYNQSRPSLFTSQHPLNLSGISCPFSFNHVVYHAHSPNFWLLKSYLSFKWKTAQMPFFPPQIFVFGFLVVFGSEWIKDPLTLL